MRAFINGLVLMATVATQGISHAQTAAPAEDSSGNRFAVDRIVAVVEDRIITYRELEKKAASYLEQIDAKADAKQYDGRKAEILRQVLELEIGEVMVDKEIAANRDKLGVTDKDIERAVAEVMKMNNLNRDQLQAALYGQGMTWKEYEDKLRAQIERARLIQFKVQGRVQLGEADAKRRCQERAQIGATTQVCASHILVRVADGASADDVERQRGRATKLYSDVLSGADFATTAQKYSDDKASPDGNLGCFGKSQMVEAFEKAAFALKVGDISTPVRTEFGFHIIKVHERKAASTTAGACDDAKVLKQYKNEVYQEELDRQMRAWMTELRRKAFVEIRL